LENLDRVQVEEGEYLVQILEVSIGTVYQGGGRATRPSGKAGSPTKMVARCRIIDGPHLGRELPLYVNLKLAGGNVPEGSHYFTFWVTANNYQRPKRRDLAHMSPRMFVGKVFVAKVRTVKPRHPDGSEKHETFWYSIVDYLQKLVAGGSSLSFSSSDSRSNSSSNLGIPKAPACP
jgi:hypothetical protein